MATVEEMQTEALTRARTGQALTNYPAIFAGFEAKGIPPEQIAPRENVFTYRAWQKLGRQVRKGEKGVRVVTRRTGSKKNPKTGKEERYSFPWCATVFHLTQTDLIGGAA